MQDRTRRAPTLWTKSQGPIRARSHTLELAHKINRLLVAPIAVLPRSEGDPVLPFQIGIRQQIEERLKPDADPRTLNAALRRYVYSPGYAIACAQPGAMRHDLDGKPVEPVSETDRLTATIRILANNERRKNRDAKIAQGDVAMQKAP